MRIICSAEKGEIEHPACLECVLASKIPPCGFDYALLKALFSDTEQEKRKNEIHVTDLTGCIKKAWYDKCDPSAEYVHEKLTRWMGTAVHAHAEGADEFMDSELKLEADGIVGRADVIYKDGRVSDFKTSRWLYPDKLPYGSHALQVNVYAFMLRQMGREVTSLQIQYIDMSGPTKCRACKVPVRRIGGELMCPNCLKVIANAHLGAVLVNIPLMTDQEVRNQIDDRKEALMASIASGMAPEPEPGFLCAYCSSFGNKCVPT